MVTLLQETTGKTFLKRLDIAKENKTTFFAFLHQSILKANPTEDEHYICRMINGITDLDAMVSYKGTLIEMQINRNEDAIQRSQEQLCGLRNLGDNNFDYEVMVQRKIAVLASLKLETEDYLYVGMQRYVKDKKYGTVKDFKRDFSKYITSLRASKIPLNFSNVRSYVF